MDYNLSIINRSQVPANLYLKEGPNKEWDMIHFFEFNNGLKYVIGSEYSLGSPKHIVDNMEHELDYVLENNTPDELQDYYYEYFQEFKSLDDCVKIFNYYSCYYNLIKEVINFYKEKSEHNSECNSESDIELYIESSDENNDD
jgi:hypothetical protein